MLRSNNEITSIYERQAKTVYRLCYTYLKNTSDTEDAVQSVFIKLINHNQSFKSLEHEKAWLLTCAANHCKDILKSAYRKRTDFDIPDIAETKAENDAQPELLEAILQLPDKYKESLYLHYYEGYKTDEIARMVEKPASTVRSHLSEARKILREKLGGEFSE